MKSFLSFRRYFLIAVALFPALTLPDVSQAALSCNAQSGITTIGLEWIAKQCIPEGVNDSTTIYYLNNMLECPGATVSLYAFFGDTQGTPTSIINYWKAQGYRVFRNKEGSQIIAVHPSYTGLIDGKSMNSYATGQVYTDVFSGALYLNTATPDCKGGDANRPPLEQCGNSTVNMQTGRLSHSQQIFATKSSQPLALDISLYYRSIQFAPSTIGNGWSHSYEMSLQNGTGNSKVFWNQGQRRVYEKYNSSYVSPKGDFSTLVINGDNTYTITEKDGLKLNFDTAGAPTSIVDRNNNTLNFTYTNGKLTTVTDPNGRAAIFTYDGNNKLHTITDPETNVYTLAYTGGNLSGVIHPDNGQWAYTYGTNGLLATKTDPENNGVSYTYDSSNRMYSTTDPASKTRGYAFAASITNTGKIPDPYPVNLLPPKQLVFTEKDGNNWTYTYDTLTETIKSKTDPLNNTTSYTYDSQGNVLTKTDPGIGTTTYTYDSKGNILTLKDPLNQTTTYTYNSFGQILTVTGAPGNTTNTYDTKGNLLTSTDPSSALIQYAYDTKGNLTTITDARNKVTTLAYDAPTNNLTSITLPTTAVVQFTYDANGNLLTATDAANKVTSYTYDGNNRLATITDPLNNVTTYTYDKNGNPTIRTDANNKVATYAYNFQNQLLSVKDALDNVTGFTYGIAGCPSCTGVDQLTKLTDARNQQTTWTYDSLGRLSSETDPLDKSTSFSYNATPNPASKTDANNATTSYTYDNLQRLTAKTYPGSSGESYTYDSRNNILTAVNVDISYTFTYDGANRIKSASDSRGYVINYDYDANGNRTKLTLQPGTTDERIIDYTYDDASRLATLTANSNLFTYGYDLNNRRTSLVYPNQITATYSYDDADRLTSIVHRRPDNSIVTSAAYTLDVVGNRTAKSGSSSESYGYDNIYRLLQAITPKGTDNFTYDTVGNRATGPAYSDTAFLHDAANRMSQGRRLTYSHDNNGNQTERTVPAATDKSWQHTWDYENRLIKSEKIKGAERRTVTFKYDPFGRRIEKILTTVIDDVTKTSNWLYVYDNNDIALEIYTDENNTPTRTVYTHGLGIDEHLALERSNSYYFFHQDGLNSVTAITDASRDVVQSYSYDSYGLPTPSSINGIRNSYAFTGREWDKEAGLYFYRARYYDPLEGRFISKDPIGFGGGDVNVFAYVQNNPLNFIDPDGLALFDPGNGFRTFPMGGGGGGGGRSTDFIVSPRGTAYPVPKGAAGPVPVTSKTSGSQTGSAFTGGSGGANGQVNTMRIMNPTPPRGSDPGYPKGYIKYENPRGQGVDPCTGRTLPNSKSHYPID